MLVAAAAAAAALRAVYYNNSTRFNDITAADGAAAVVVAYTHANYICVMCLCGRRVCVCRLRGGAVEAIVRAISYVTTLCCKRIV